MNETWPWWGSPGVNGGAKIYQQMRDYFNSQGQRPGGWSNYYPGSNYVDAVSLDAWYKAYPSSSDYQQIQSIAGSKPIAIAEMGKMPTYFRPPRPWVARNRCSSGTLLSKSGRAIAVALAPGA
jgi:mannan endo-1,4-beta-mannosidase